MSDRLFLHGDDLSNVYAIFGSYVTARLAPNRPMGHALIGAIIGLIWAPWVRP